MSTVYLAIQMSVGREVALKVMSPALNADPVFSQRFQREANIVGQLSHPNIVSIYDIGCYRNLNYIAMDYLPGGTIHDKMKTELPVSEILRIIKEIARALDVAHNKGYVHRDIKPENVLFREDNTAVLSDFGVAKAISTTSASTNAGLVVGTPHYMSPEQSRGLAIDGRSDIYSLGVVFYEMLTGRVPYQADEAVAIAIKHVTAPIPTLPPQYAVYQPLLNKFIAKNANERFQRGQEIIDAIEHIEDTLSGHAARRNSLTDPDTMNVMTLFKALLLTSYAVLQAKSKTLLGNLLGWRWTPKRGFYHRPKTKVTEIKTNIDSSEERRVTVISTRIRNAAHYQDVASRKLSYVTRAFMFLFVCSIIWSAVSVGLVRFGIVSNTGEPNALVDVIYSTAGAIDNYTGRLSGYDALASPSTTAVAANGKPTTQSVSTNVNRTASLASNSSPQSDLLNNRSLASSVSNSSGITQPVLRREPETKPEPVFFNLLVNTLPEDARVRILNIRERYRPNIKLTPGNYHIEVSQSGYETVRRWLTVSDADVATDVQLQPLYTAGDVVVHILQDGTPAPEMIVLPTGSFTMGNKSNAQTAPERQVDINYRLAAGKYEVTFAAYSKFVEDTGAQLPSDNKWGQGSRPVINVSWHDANAYAQWLSEQTDRTYRLPTEAEWEFMARADTDGSYWWGEESMENMANCRRGCKSEFAGLFSSKSAPVGNYAANPFGLHDTAGNVAEWVQDCYQNHFIGGPTDGSAIEPDNCAQRTVRGGSLKNSAKDISNDFREGMNPDAKTEEVGFRLVLELE